MRIIAFACGMGAPSRLRACCLRCTADQSAIFFTWATRAEGRLAAVTTSASAGLNPTIGWGLMLARWPSSAAPFGVFASESP